VFWRFVYPGKLTSHINAILLDIEGTTTPIDFVHKVLFPFSRSRMPEFVRENFDKLNTEIAQLAAEHASDTTYRSAFDENSPVSVTEFLQFLIDSDRKSTPLKSIQGMIWRDGYHSGEIRSQVFGDVPLAFRRWSAAGKQIAIYSSGSILAQGDLFKHTDHGDLTPYIRAYFDTATGGKKEAESYVKIATELAIEPDKILFVSDVLEELDSARIAGMQTALSIREENAHADENHDHPMVRSFEELEPKLI
jgi:enolase-phosphatase E1